MRRCDIWYHMIWFDEYDKCIKWGMNVIKYCLDLSKRSINCRHNELKSRFCFQLFCFFQDLHFCFNRVGLKLQLFVVIPERAPVWSYPFQKLRPVTECLLLWNIVFSMLKQLEMNVPIRSRAATVHPSWGRLACCAAGRETLLITL